MDIYKIRRDNLHKLCQTHGGVMALAARIDRDPSQISRYLAHPGNNSRRVGDKMAVHIETSMKLPTGWVSTQHSNALPEHPLIHATCQYLNNSPDPQLADILATLLTALTPKQ